MSVSKKSRTLLPDEGFFDVTVVGAGIGGLCTAALLARQGKKVLVVDAHYNLGGCCTIFRRKGTLYEFDVGLHYVGDCEEQGLIPRVLRSCGVDDIEWLEMDPDGYDIAHFGDDVFRYPRSESAFKQRLLELFPRERRGIERYFKLLKQVWDFLDIPRDPKSVLWKGPRSLLLFRYMNATLANFLDSCTDNPELRGIIAGQVGLHHQPPSRASLVGHAGVTEHFLQGAFYPRGGGQILADKLAESIESNGGKILLNTPVTKIIVKNGAATGVEVNHKREGRQVISSRCVISNADYKKTVEGLVGPENISRKIIRSSQNMTMAPGMSVLYLILNRDLAKEGHTNANIRIYPSYDMEACYKKVLNGEFPERPHLFIGNASLKNPGDTSVAPLGHTNLQIMSAVPNLPEAWGVSAADVLSGNYHENPRYQALKAQFADAMLQVTEQVIPNIKGNIVFQEVSTPITTGQYLGSSGGTSYGLSMVPSQFMLKRPGPSTEIKNLYLCGCNTRAGHGVFGAMTSSVLAAAEALGRISFVPEALNPS